MKVLIAGGGVAAVEALLALHDLAPDLIRVELLAPEREFVHRPLLVAEPFGAGTALRRELSTIVADAGATLRRDALEEVQPERRTVTTAGGEELAYDALLITIGARPVPAVPGALTFGGEPERREFSEMLETLAGEAATRLAFVVPPDAKWPIAAYELALLTRSHLDARGARGTGITLVTHEAKPLDLFGPPATELIGELLSEAGIELRTASAAVSFEGGALALSDGERIQTDRAVALPALEVPPIPGIPHRGDGFVPTDTVMRVTPLEHVWAAGDVTWFPIKQGGLAAQQAFVAASAIAARAGASVGARAFQPILRGALLTGELPRYLRSMIAKPDGSTAAARPLWSPPEKLAGRYLAPYLARLRGGRPGGNLEDLEAP